MRIRNSIAIVFGSLATTISAQAQLIVTGQNCDCSIPPSAYEIIPLANGHFDVNLLLLYEPFQANFFEIRPTSPGVIIDNVRSFVNGPPAGAPVIVRVSPGCPVVFPCSPSNNANLKIQTVHNISQEGNAETLLNRVDVSGDLGSVTIQAIGDMFVGGDVTGNIMATTPDNPSRGINYLRAEGSIFGNLEAPFGRMRFIEAIAGDIGTPANPVTIACKYNIDTVDAVFNNMYANIDTTLNGGRGTIGFLRAETFAGSLVTAQIVPAGGPFNGQIRVNVELAADITIGQSFVQPSFMDLEPGGLTGQVIVNANNLGGAWDTSIFFGDPANPDLELTGPGYTETAASLGGGSVGLAPFSLHDESCDPPNGATVPNSVGNLSSVKLRHYGPITTSGPGVEPLSFERRLAGTMDPFTSVPAAQFDFTLPASDDNSIVVTAAGAFPHFEVGFEYRIQPTLDLVCDRVAGNPAVNWVDYTVVVGSCDADVHLDGVVDVLDLMDLLTCFGQPAVPACGAEDINEDGTVNVLDLIDLLLDFGTTCP